MPELFTLNEAAAILRVSRQTLYNLRRLGKIRFTPIAGKNRIIKEELLNYINENTGRCIKEIRRENLKKEREA